MNFLYNYVCTCNMYTSLVPMQAFEGRGEGKERLVRTVLRMRLISTISRENRIFQ